MIYGDSLQIPATVRQSNRANTICTVTAISDTIIKFNCAAQFNPELPIMLKMGGLNLLTANLLWKKNHEYGCQVDHGIHPAVINDVMDRLDQKRIERVV